MLVYKLKKNRTSTTPLSRVYTNRYIMSLYILYCTLILKNLRIKKEIFFFFVPVRYKDKEYRKKRNLSDSFFF